MKKITLEEVLDFINLNYLDDRLFIVIPHLYEDRQFELLWNRDSGEPVWYLREKHTNQSYQAIYTNDLIDTLNREKIDILEFHAKLIEKMLTHVAYLKIVVKKAEEIFGTELVHESYVNLEKYYDKLLNAVDETLNPKEDKKSKFKVIK